MHHVTKHLVTEKKGEVVGAMAKVRVARLECCVVIFVCQRNNTTKADCSVNASFR